MRKLTTILLVGTMFLLGAIPALATTDAGQYQVWVTPAEYEKATGNKIEKYSEAPELRTLVAAGELPPVEKRLPKEPLVVRGFDGEIGRYGGIYSDIWSESLGHVRGTYTMAFLLQGYYPFRKVYPNIIKSFEMTDTAGKEWTIKLREGMKWSDGYPLTADDFLFAFNDIVFCKELTPDVPLELKSEDGVATIEKIDDYTIKYCFPKRYRFMQKMSQDPGWSIGGVACPKHYLKQFHPLYTNKDELEELTKEGGFGSWTELFTNKVDWKNVDLPTLAPWVLVQAPPDMPVISKRNPYYWVVDEKGNQLPYIDETRYEYYDEEVVNLRVLAGQFVYAEELPISLYPEFKKAEKEGKLRIVMWTYPAPVTDTIEFNLTVKDPVKRKIFRDKRFRFAVSHAIDREMINELVYQGLCEPQQSAPSKNSPFYHERLAHTALEYDTKKANALLDEIGLDKRDANGFRLAPNGEKLQINFLACPWNQQVAELGIDMLKAVGLNCSLRIVGFMPFVNAREANEHEAVFMWGAWSTTEGRYLDNQAGDWLPISGDGWCCFWSSAWRDWYFSKGERGEKPIPVLLEAIEYYEKAQAAWDIEEQKKWFGKVLDIAADNLWVIGILSYHGGCPALLAITPNLRNFPTSSVAWYYGDRARMGCYFFEE